MWMKCKKPLLAISASCMIGLLVYAGFYLVWRHRHFMTNHEYMPCPCHGGPGPGVLYVSVNAPSWVRSLFHPMIWCDQKITHVSQVSE